MRVPAETTSATARRRRGAVAAVVIAVAIAGATLIVQRAAALRWIGSLLVAEDALVRADAIVPLAGGSWDREIEAAELFGGGYAPRIALTREPEEPNRGYLAARGIHFPTAEENRLRVLVALGVPRDRIHVIERPVTSTLDEARFVGEWAARAGLRSVLVVTSPYHTARSKYIFERYAATPKTMFVMRGTTLSPFKLDSWWTSRATLREGIFELEKLLAYRVRY